MDLTDYMLWKLAVLTVLAFVWGMFCGLTGRSLSGEKLDREEGQAHREQEGRETGA